MNHTPVCYIKEVMLTYIRNIIIHTCIQAASLSLSLSLCIYTFWIHQQHVGEDGDILPFVYSSSISLTSGIVCDAD